MQAIDPRNLPSSFTITQARGADLGEHPRLLDGFLYVGAMVLFSEPGLGKSMLTGAVEEHLAFGRPFGPWIPEHAYRCLVLDFEGDMRLASERSLTNTPWGLLPSDHGRPVPADIEYETEFPGDGFFGRLGALEQRLDAAAQQGQPYAYVRIDTMRLFLGSKPHGVNAYEWDAMAIKRLNQLALAYNLALILVHHTNKAGEVSGSTGVAGSASVVAQLKRNPDNDDECLLVSHKVRVDAPFRYPVVMDDRGRWEFTEDITPTQAELGGTKRKLVDLLTSRGPKVMSDIRAALPDLNANTIKAALRRLTADNVVCYRRGQWQLTQATIQEHPKCIVCGTNMNVYLPRQTMHPTCEPDPQEQATIRTWLGTPVVPSPAGPADQEPEHDERQEEDEGEDEHPEGQRFPAIREMNASLDQSRMKPLRRVRKEERESKPWSLVTERMDGHFRTKSWTGELPEDTTHVGLFDRNGSYPSALSSVPVAPNKLTHTGPLGTDPLKRGKPAMLAGLFQIRVPEWTDPRIPHPLGRTGEVGVDELCWVVGGHLEFLDQLAAKGIMPVVEVVDSWTGRRNTSLFERYYKWARTVREQTKGQDEATRTEAKQAISKAIRLLHPRNARSPFWRPDWHKSALVEASIRHWTKAYGAVQQGAVLLSIGAVDEVAFAVPTDVEDPKLWVPPGYRMGAGYGEVKHKELLVAGEKIMTPVTVEQWNNRGRAARRA